tara:strand:+ start:5752 stop:6078 length:327 start_codon:yes stop_codon:yes gene_type:complete
MGKVTRIRLPEPLKKQIRGSVLGATAFRIGTKPYTPAEVKSYLQMYISGYTRAEVSKHFDVSESRVTNAFRHVENSKYYVMVSKANKIRRLGKQRLIELKDFDRVFQS